MDGSVEDFAAQLNWFGGCRANITTRRPGRRAYRWNRRRSGRGSLIRLRFLGQKSGHAAIVRLCHANVAILQPLVAFGEAYNLLGLPLLCMCRNTCAMAGMTLMPERNEFPVW
jgi:hypothetical protein